LQLRVERKGGPKKKARHKAGPGVTSKVIGANAGILVAAMATRGDKPKFAAHQKYEVFDSIPSLRDHFVGAPQSESSPTMANP
jgi:hypothetical protein